MKDTQIEVLYNYMNYYYECDIRSKCRKASNIEGRGMFIVLARRELDLKCSQIASFLGMSESNVVRTHCVFLDSIKNNKHIRRRFEYISRYALK